jgi:hypothetical protein
MLPWNTPLEPSRCAGYHVVRQDLDLQRDIRPTGRKPQDYGESCRQLGDWVRYDGQHKYDPFLVEMLGSFVEWERVCPEAGAARVRSATCSTT